VAAVADQQRIAAVAGADIGVASGPAAADQPGLTTAPSDAAHRGEATRAAVAQEEPAGSAGSGLASVEFGSPSPTVADEEGLAAVAGAAEGAAAATAAVAEQQAAVGSGAAGTHAVRAGAAQSAIAEQDGRAGGAARGTTAGAVAARATVAE